MLVLKKLITLLTMPLGLSVLLLLMGLLAVLMNKKYWAVASLSLGLMVLWLFSTPVVSHYIGSALEDSYPAIPIPVLVNQQPDVQAIVALGGGMSSVVQTDNYRPWPDLNDASDRVWHASKLYYGYRDQANKRLPLVLSGGSIPWLAGDSSEASAMAQFAGDLGVPAERIIEENKSLTTEENAQFTAKLLLPQHIQRIALVTSATHMRRAVLLFTQAGFEVVPVSTDQRFPPQKNHLLNFLPKVDSLEKSTLALHEWLWLLIYAVKNGA